MLVVDDEPAAVRTLVRLLSRAGYSVIGAASAEDARQKLLEGTFALVLSDVNMPGDSGIDLLETIASSGRDIATVMVTGVDDRDLAERAMAIGAYGYVIKPFEPNEILINVSNAFRRRELEIESRNHRSRLEQMVQERTAHLWTALGDLEKSQAEVKASNEKTIAKLAIAAEYRDEATANHVERMSRYCGLLAARLGEDDERVRLIRTASIMHDVGKIGIPDGILFKPGKLDDEEWRIMKTHSEIGARILSDESSALLEMASTIALTHHERFDGSGYPQALAGRDIPLEGRLAAVADVFDALTTNRVYRKAFTLGEAVDMMSKERGTHFQPELLDLFLGAMDEVLKITVVPRGG